eukprot:Hpha_TRINITY_DN22362_c0_g1::TRINITY_DN22362_c0_g1_i1::g.177836::m.177836
MQRPQPATTSPPQLAYEIHGRVRATSLDMKQQLLAVKSDSWDYHMVVFAPLHEKLLTSLRANATIEGFDPLWCPRTATCPVLAVCALGTEPVGIRVSLLFQITSGV